MINPAVRVSEKMEREHSISKNKQHELKPQARMNILIIDDDLESIFPLKKILMDYGCHVYLAKDGYEAIEFLSHDVDIKLVFLDWNMPHIEGGETIKLAEKYISESPESQEFWLGRNMPVVTYTAEDSKKIKVPRVSHFSFVDHWPKSMGPETLFFQVREILNYIREMSH